MGENPRDASAIAHCPSRYSPRVANWMHDERAERRDARRGRSRATAT
jgi:hypothetical protein